MVKRQLLINVLCILVYNYDYSLKNSPEAKDRISKEKNMEALLEELNKRKALVAESEEWIMDYAKRVVFPKLRLAWRASD